MICNAHMDKRKRKEQARREQYPGRNEHGHVPETHISENHVNLFKRMIAYGVLLASALQVPAAPAD
jgi:hypothetical protein